MALQLVERHGVVTREAVLAEGVVGGYAGVYGVLKVLEERGQVRRGYFVSGLGAAQFALPGAVDRLRQVREHTDERSGVVAAPVVLTATDPAQPFGAALTWPETNGHPARTGAALVVLRDGVPLAWYDRRSFHLVTFAATLDDRSWAEALADQVRAGRLRKVELRKVDGDPLSAAPAGAIITAAAKSRGSSTVTAGSCSSPLIWAQKFSTVEKERARTSVRSIAPSLWWSVGATDGAEPGPGQVADLAGDQVRIEAVAPFDEAAAGALRQPDQCMGEGEAVFVVDVGRDQGSDQFGRPVGDLPEGVGELVVAPRDAAVEQHERVVVLGDPPEVRLEPAFGLLAARGGLGGGGHDRRQQPRAHVVDQRLVQLALGVEVLIQHRLGDPRRVGDVVHRCVVVAAAGEDPEGHLEQLLSAGGRGEAGGRGRGLGDRGHGYHRVTIRTAHKPRSRSSRSAALTA